MLLPELDTFLATLIDAKLLGKYTEQAKTLRARLREFVSMPDWQRSTLYHLVNCYDYGQIKLSSSYDGWHTALNPVAVRDFFAQLKQKGLLAGELSDARFDHVILTPRGFQDFKPLKELIW